MVQTGNCPEKVASSVIPVRQERKLETFVSFFLLNLLRDLSNKFNSGVFISHMKNVGVKPKTRLLTLVKQLTNSVQRVNPAVNSPDRCSF